MQITENTGEIKLIPHVYKLIEAGFKLLPKKGKVPTNKIQEGHLYKLRERPININNAPFYFPESEQHELSVAIFTGDQLECIDFEGSFLQSGEYDELYNTLKYLEPGIFEKLTIETSPNGKHWFYKCTHTGSKIPLARREGTPQEILNGDKVILLIESLGENQTVNVFPSPGYSQEKNDLLLVQEITPEERAFIHSQCRSYDKLRLPEVAEILRGRYKDPKAVWNVFNEQHDYNSLREWLQEAGWTIGRETQGRISVKRPGSTNAATSGSILKEKNFLYIFSTSTEFPSDTILSPFDVIKYLKYNGDFKQCAKGLSDQGYGVFEENEAIEVSFFDIKKERKGKYAPSLNRGRFLDFFHAAGVGLLMINKAAVLIKLTGATFEKVTTEQLRKLVLDHINTLPESFDCGVTRLDLQEVILKGSDSYFSKSFLEFIKHFSPDYLQDTKEMAYVPFRNGVACVSAGRVELKSYEQLGKHIWKDHVIDFDIDLDQSRACESIWFKFLCCICGNDNLPTFTTEQHEKLLYIESIAGYLCHKYKDPSRPYAIILAEETQSDDKGGGTGKGLFMKGQSFISPTCIISGKKFNPADRFAWQRVELHHKIVAIDDTAKNFIFESLNNAVTDGLTIEGKNEQEIMLSYEDSPKIVVISNYVIPNSSNHAKRRQRVFEFSPFFSPGYTPEKHFGHILFQDWNRDEWNRFYNFQIFCIRQYLNNGLPDRAKSDILKRREVKQKYGDEFDSWFFDSYLQNGYDQWQGVTDLYNEFLKFSEQAKDDFSMKKFKAAILSGCCLFGHDRQDRRNNAMDKRSEMRVLLKKMDRI